MNSINVIAMARHFNKHKVSRPCITYFEDSGTFRFYSANGEDYEITQELGNLIGHIAGDTRFKIEQG